MFLSDFICNLLKILTYTTFMRSHYLCALYLFFCKARLLVVALPLQKKRYNAHTKTNKGYSILCAACSGSSLAKEETPRKEKHIKTNKASKGQKKYVFFPSEKILGRNTTRSLVRIKKKPRRFAPNKRCARILCSYLLKKPRR